MIEHDDLELECLRSDMLYSGDCQAFVCVCRWSMNWP